jgi:membrane-bound serine protease (ClpP class)
VLLAIAILLAVFVLPPALGIAVMAVAAVVEVGEVFFWRRFLRRYRVSTGAEGLIGEAAVVVEPCDPNGRVKVRGELWNARAAEPLGAGESATVTGVDGLTLAIARAEER